MNDSKNVNLFFQGKGGIGKSVAASFLTQFYRENFDNDYLAIDADPATPTLISYKDLETQPIKLLDEKEVFEQGFDDLIELIIKSNKNIIVDIGASSFLKIDEYISSNNILEYLSSLNKNIIFHNIITNGQETSDLLYSISKSFFEHPNINRVIWINEINSNKSLKIYNDFVNSNFYDQNKTKLKIVYIRNYSSWHATDLRNMLNRKLTFNEAIADPNFSYMSKQRLMQYKNDIFLDLSTIFKSTTNKGN